MKLFDYKCRCGKVEERLVQRADDEVFCSCGQLMQRKASAPSTSFHFADVRYSQPKLRKR